MNLVKLVVVATVGGTLVGCSAAQGDASPLNGSWHVARVTTPGHPAVDVSGEKATLDVHGEAARADDGTNVYDATYRVGDHGTVAVTGRDGSAVGYPATSSRERQAAIQAVQTLMQDGSLTVSTSGDSAVVTAGATSITLRKN